MADATLAASYSRALFEKAVEKYARDLHALNSSLSKSSLLTRLDNPSESFEGKQALLNGMLPPDADLEVRNLAFLLASKNQVHLLPQIVGEFDRAIARDKGGAVAHVTSAIDLTADEKTALESKLRKQYGADLVFDYDVDAAIIGGVVVRIGDVVIDGSVAGKLAAMKQNLQTVR